MFSEFKTAENDSRKTARTSSNQVKTMIIRLSKQDPKRATGIHREISVHLEKPITKVTVALRFEDTDFNCRLVRKKNLGNVIAMKASYWIC